MPNHLALLCLCATSALLLNHCLSLSLRDAMGGPAHDSGVPSGGKCGEKTISGGPAKELKSAPNYLARVLGLAVAAAGNRNWARLERLGCFVLLPVEQHPSYGDGGGGGRGRKELPGDVRGAEGATADVCVGKAVVKAGEGGGEVGIVREKNSKKVLFLLIRCTLPARHNITVRYSCGEEPQCFTFNIQASRPSLSRFPYRSHSRLHKRVAVTAGEENGRSSRPNRPNRARGSFSSVVVVGGVCVVGILGLLAVIALCAHTSDEYDPATPIVERSEVATTVLTVEQTEPQENPVENGAHLKPPTSGDNPSMGVSSAQKSTPSMSDNHSNFQLSGSEEVLIKQELPNVPTPHAAEEVREKRQRSLSEEQDGGEKVRENENKYDLVDHKEDKGPYDYIQERGVELDKNGEYAYARVSGNARQAKVGAPQEKPTGQLTPPPYGKVTRHMMSAPPHRGSYSEVRRSIPSSPLGVSRVRSLTDPPEPPASPGAGPRSERAQTDSATRMPLPQIPNLHANDDTCTYDYIPEEVKSSIKSKPSTPHPVRDSVYESVDEAKGNDGVDGGEDVYESVPEDIKPSTSPPISPSSPLPLPPRSPSIPFQRVAAESPLSPPSPSSKKEFRNSDDGKKKNKSKKEKQDEGKKHKSLGKTVSDTNTDSRGRSISSLFHRKRAGSTEKHPAIGKLKILPNEPRIVPPEPPPAVPMEAPSAPTSSHFSPPHHPPPIPIPLPPDDDDAAYDTPSVINPQLHVMLGSNAARAGGRSASLPTSMRNAGAAVFNPNTHHAPLPRLPEELNNGVVTRLRMMEYSDSNYDTIVIERDEDEEEPNYDSIQPIHTDVERERGANMPKLEPALHIAVREQQLAGAERSPANYAKVTKHNPAGTASTSSEISSPLSATVSAPAGASLTPDRGAYLPEHDELGYAVIPAHLKLRKRTQSEVMQKSQQEAQLRRHRSEEELDDVKCKEGSEVLVPMQGPDEPQYESVSEELKQNISPSSHRSDGGWYNVSEESEYPYATVDKAAKRQSQLMRELAEKKVDPSEVLGRLPTPPPLPQQGDLGDLSEFSQPPIPTQMEGILQLIDPSYSRIQETTGGNKTANPYAQIYLTDPPYASVKQRLDREKGEGKLNVNTETDGGSDPPYASVKKLQGESGKESPDSHPYARIREKAMEDDEDPGYDKAGIKLGEKEREEEYEEPAHSNAASSAEHPGHSEGHHLEARVEKHTYDRLNYGLGSLKPQTDRRVVGDSQEQEVLSLKPQTDRRVVGDSQEQEVLSVTVDFSGSVSSPPITETKAISGSGSTPILEIDTEEKSIKFN